MRTQQQVKVFEDAEFIREAIVGLCEDKLPRSADPDRRAAVDRLCWDTMPLQGRNLDFNLLREKCSAILVRNPSEPIRRLSPELLAHEISSPVDGW